MIYPNKPHPQSYRPDLPLPTVAQMAFSGMYYKGSPIYQPTRSLLAWADKLVANGARPVSAPRVHPDGYRPDLPTRGYSCAQLMRPTAADRAYEEAHPLTYEPATEPWQHCAPCLKCGGRR